jgi:hypothetical protein
VRNGKALFGDELLQSNTWIIERHDEATLGGDQRRSDLAARLAR